MCVKNILLRGASYLRHYYYLFNLCRGYSRTIKETNMGFVEKDLLIDNRVIEDVFEYGDIDPELS